MRYKYNYHDTVLAKEDHIRSVLTQTTRPQSRPGATLRCQQRDDFPPLSEARL